MQSRYFALARPKAVLETSVEYEEEKQTTPSNTSEEQTLTKTTKLEVGTEGYAYHPALAVFSVNLRPEFKSQDTNRDPGADINNQLIFFGFDVDSTFLQYKPYTLNLFSSRNRSEFDSSLASDTITESSTDRATLFLKYQPLPTTLTAERRTTNFEGLRDFEDTTISTRALTRHRTDASTSSARVEYTQQERDGEATSLTVERLLASTRNLYKFSDDVRLTSGLTGNRTTTSTRETTVFDANTNLFLQHDDSLNSQHQLRYNDRQEDDFFSRSVFGSSQLSHQLYENLVTTPRASALYETFDDGDIRVYDGNLDFRYRRKLPLRDSTIGLTNSYGVELTDDNINARFNRVDDESLTLATTSPVFLARDNIDINTIVVTDSTGLTIFSEGTDYIVSDFGGTIAIQRTGVGSTIPDGAAVLVDYRFTADGPSEILEKRIRGGIDLNFYNMLKLFYNFNLIDETLLSGIEPSSLANDFVQRTGAEFKWRWSTTEFEYEDRDTVRTPITRWRARETVSYSFSRKLSLRLNASYSETTLVDTDDVTTQFNQSARVRWQPFRNGELTVEAFNRLTGGDIQETEDRGLGARFRYRFGLWAAETKYDFLRQENITNNQERDEQRILFKVTREF